MTPQYKNMLLISLSALNAAERAEAAEMLLQTAIFLARYAFLLEPASENDNFLKPQNALTGEIHAQNVHVARYLDPKYSMWLSADPALGEYIPAAPVSDEAKKHNQNLPGMGGVFNTVNLNLYHYAGNNPVRYVDPDGRMEEDISLVDSFLSNADQITAFLFAVCEAVARGKPAVESVLSQKYNDLGIVDGVVTGFKLVRGDSYTIKQITETSGKVSNFFLGLSITLNFMSLHQHV